jgi:LAO/AO transport system kinase
VTVDTSLLDELLEGVEGGDRRSLARLMSVVEEGGEGFRYLSSKMGVGHGGSYSIGITGAPGAGKSTLTDALVGEVLASGSRVAVIAVDPSSPFTGGAILGDRVRLREEHARSTDVFVRSLASRMHLGGLALAVPGMVRALDSGGWPIVLIETVGVGQSEVAIARSADTTIVVVNPGWGDEVQANKAGLLEIADLLVVNKSDRDGAESTVRDLERMLHLGAEREWTPPIVRTVAGDGGGVDELWIKIGEHRQFLEQSGLLGQRRGESRINEMHERIQVKLARELRSVETGSGAEILLRVASGDLDPNSAAERFVELLGKRLDEFDQ